MLSTVIAAIISATTVAVAVLSTTTNAVVNLSAAVAAAMRSATLDHPTLQVYLLLL